MTDSRTWASIVKANVVFSSGDPNVQITVPKNMRYVGTDAWVLYGIADCRQYLFAQTDARNTVKRLYWIQFEAYVASIPKLHHLYTSTRHTRLDGRDFYVDTWIEETRGGKGRSAEVGSLETYLRLKGYAVPAAINSGSDEEHVDALFAAKDDRLPAIMASVRLVHLADADARNGARGYGRWKAFEAGLIRRAEENVVVSFRG